MFYSFRRPLCRSLNSPIRFAIPQPKSSYLGFLILNTICFLCQFVGDLFIEDVFDGNGDELALDFFAIGH